MPFFEGMVTGLRHFVRNLLRRDRVERELSDEIDGYVDLLMEECHRTLKTGQVGTFENRPAAGTASIA
jgi:hypothetical protein